MKFASRVRNLGTEAAFELLAQAQKLEAKGRSILHFEMGEPLWETDSSIVDAAVRALNSGRTKYSNAAGELALRSAIAKDVSKRRRVSVTPDEVVVVPGAKPVLFFAALALIEPGDEVILSDPGFPIFESVVRFAGGKPVFLPLRIENQFQPDPREVKQAFSAKTKMVIVNSPHNPTGMIWERDTIQLIAHEVLHRRDCWLLSDEIYSQMIFDGVRHFSPLAIRGMKSRTVLVDGFSKTYSMTGWRLGYGVMPEELAALMTKFVINTVSCVPAFIQEAGLAALQSPNRTVASRTQELQNRRDLLCAGLSSLPGFEFTRPQATPYVFPRVHQNEVQLSQRILQEAGVACLPGTAFGRLGAKHLRFSFTNSPRQIQDAIRRMKEIL